LCLRRCLSSASVWELSTHQAFADWVDATAAAEHPGLLAVPAFARCAGDVGSGCGLLDDKLLREPTSKLSVNPKTKPPRWPKLGQDMLQRCADELREAASVLLAHPTAKTAALGGGGAKNPAAILEKVVAAISPAGCGDLLKERRENMITGARDMFLVPGAKGPSLDSTTPLPWVDEVGGSGGAVSALTAAEAADLEKVMGHLRKFKENTHAKAPKQIAEEKGKGIMSPAELVRERRSCTHLCTVTEVRAPLVVCKTIVVLTANVCVRCGSRRWRCGGNGTIPRRQGCCNSRPKTWLGCNAGEIMVWAIRATE
jgi:hypothetical protein